YLVLFKVIPDAWRFEATTYFRPRLVVPPFGATTRTGMNMGWVFAHAMACRFVSKNWSITIALRSWDVRPARRAALRVRTAEPVSTAASFVPSARTTWLPYGMWRGSTAQCPVCNRQPVAVLCRRV